MLQNKDMAFKNLIEVITYFADKTVATEFLIKARWHGKITCPHCKSENVNRLNGKTPAFKCYGCRQLFSATKGTIFENSPIHLQKWFAAIYLITSHKKGISSHQIAKDISVTQKSAWFMLQRIRFAQQSGTFEFNAGSTVQVDETFIGGKEKNKHQSRIARNERKNILAGNNTVKFSGRSLGVKTPVVGMIATGGMVVAKVVKDTKSGSLIPFITENVAKGATIVTDEWAAYVSLRKDYNHESVKHRLGEYVRGPFHTNGIENFWSIFKRGIIGIYHHVSSKHLDKYVDEFEFRFNTRLNGEAERFEKLVSLCNRRLTYNELIADI